MKDEPRLPELGEHVRGAGTLVEIQDVTPTSVVEDYIFEDITFRVEARCNGHVVKHFYTYTTIHGVENGLSAAIKEAEKLADTYDDVLEIVVVKETHRGRARPHPVTHGNFYDNAFIRFKLLDVGSTRGLPDIADVDVWSNRGGYL